jgi:uncharacterized sporulation protein YeaH/YhbH (DUF444 family)
MSDINTGRTGTPLGDALRELVALRAENSELRGLLAETVPDPEYRRMQDIEIERLREERKRLREALERIVYHASQRVPDLEYSIPWRHIEVARVALAEAGQ